MIATDSQVIPEGRQQIGWVINYVMVANINFAVCIMMNDSIRETIRQCKMKKKRSLAKKMMKERKAAQALKRSIMATTVEKTVQERPLSPIEEEKTLGEPQVVQAKFKINSKARGKKKRAVSNIAKNF